MEQLAKKITLKMESPMVLSGMNLKVNFVCTKMPLIICLDFSVEQLC